MPNPDRRRLLAAAGALLIAPLAAHAAPPPLRVVTLEYNLVEMLLALGLPPVGVADLKGYRRWVGLGQQTLSGCVSVGTRQQPSLEAIAALRPDLILGVDFRHQPLLPLLSRLAPTRLQASDRTGNGLALMRQDFRQLAVWTGRSQAAESELARLDDCLSRLRGQLGPSAKQRMGVLQGLGGSPQFWAFAGNSLAGGVVDALGWQNAWPARDARQGIVTLTVEDLLDSTASLTAVTDPRADFTRGALWQRVPAVAEARLRRLPADTWLFGGPWSARRLAERLATAWAPAAHAICSGAVSP